jgi:hypothetical protein
LISFPNDLLISFPNRTTVGMSIVSLVVIACAVIVAMIMHPTTTLIMMPFPVLKVITANGMKMRPTPMNHGDTLTDTAVNHMRYKKARATKLGALGNTRKLALNSHLMETRKRSKGYLLSRAHLFLPCLVC